MGGQSISAGGPLLLGLDIGTSGGRAVLFDANGRSVAQANRTWAPHFPHPDWAELDPEALWAAAIDLLRSACEHAPSGQLVGVGVSCQLTTLFLDASHAPIYPVLPWADRRAESEARALEGEAGRAQIAAVAGRQAAAERPAAIARWIRRHEPAVWGRTAWVCTLKDYLVYCLTGQLATDEPHASYSLLFDVRAKHWDCGLCQVAGLRTCHLPDVVPSASVIGRIQPAAAAAIGIPAGIPVVAGGPDGTLAALGAGLTKPGVGVDVTGTTDVVFACLPEPKLDPAGGLVTNVHACPDRWLLGGPTTTTGGMLTWLADHVAKDADLGGLIDEAAGVPAGAEGVRCFPALSGDRTPVWDPHVRAALLGLGMTHRRGHCVRAILEACACVVRRVQQAIVGLGETFQEMRIVGGAVESALWSQIRADMLGLPVRPMPARNASALGAAILAATGAGVYDDVPAAAAVMSGCGELLQPHSDVREVYDRVYADFERMQGLLQTFAGTASGAA